MPELSGFVMGVIKKCEVQEPVIPCYPILDISDEVYRFPKKILMQDCFCRISDRGKDPVIIMYTKRLSDLLKLKQRLENLFEIKSITNDHDFNHVIGFFQVRATIKRKLN